MKVKHLSGFPPQANPFHHDYYHMGTSIGQNVVIMHECHRDDNAKYLIIVDRSTGKRLRMDLYPENLWQRAQIWWCTFWSQKLNWRTVNG